MATAQEEPVRSSSVDAWPTLLKLDRDRLDGWCEKGVLGLVFSILIFSPLATGAVRPQDFVVIEWLAVALAAVWLIRFWINPKHRLLWPIFCWPVLAFVVYAIGRYLTADIEFVARQELIRILVYALIFFAVLNNLHRQETTYALAMVLLFLGLVIAFYALMQFLTESDRVWNFIRPENYRKRGSGTFICPNHLAGYLEMILPLGLAYTLTGRLSHLWKVFVGYASLMIFVGIVVSVSRGGWAATGVTLIVLFLFLLRQREYRWQVLAMVAGLVAIGTIFLSSGSLSKERKERLQLLTSSDDFRRLILKPATAIWKDHWLWGVGPAHFDYRYRQYRPDSSDMQGRPGRVHNDYLNTLVDWGIVGATLVLSVWGLFYWEVFRSWSFVKRAPNDLNAKRSNKSTFVLGGALGLVAILLHSFLDYNMHIPSNAILAVTLLALVAGHFRFATDHYWHTVRWPMRLLVTVLLGLTLIYLSQQSWRATLENASLNRANAQPNFSNDQATQLKNAFAIEPMNPDTAYALGECYRMQSWQGADGYKDLAREALQWFDLGMKLNRWDPYSCLRHGMCLDWIGDHASAGEYFTRGLRLGPHDFYTLALVGWHYAQMQEWSRAEEFFKESWAMNHRDNPIAANYLTLLPARIAEEKARAQRPKDQTASLKEAAAPRTN